MEEECPLPSKLGDCSREFRLGACVRRTLQYSRTHRCKVVQLPMCGEGVAIRRRDALRCLQ
eukprot:3322065-Amphidinium_carterae.1